jgi:hypothetical protein
MLPYGVNDNVLLTRVLDETEIINMILSTTNQSSSAAADAAVASSSTETNHKDDDNLNHKVIKDDNNNHLISVENKITLVHTDGGNDINTIIDYKASLVLRSSMKNFSDINDNNKHIKEKEVTFDMNPMIRDISRASDHTNYSFNNSENTSLSSLTIDKYSFHLTTEEKEKYLTMINKNNDVDKVKRKTKNSSKDNRNNKTCDCCSSCTIM